MKASFKIETQEQVFPGGTVGGQWGWVLVETDGLGSPEEPGINPPPGVGLPVEPENPENPSTQPVPGEPVTIQPVEPEDEASIQPVPTKPAKPTKPEAPVTIQPVPEDEASIQPIMATAVDVDGERVAWQSKEAFTSIDVEPEVTYKISAVRLDPDNKPLGAPVSAIFTTEEAPEDVVIQVAGGLTVEVTS